MSLDLEGIREASVPSKGAARFHLAVAGIVQEAVRTSISAFATVSRPSRRPDTPRQTR